MMRGTGMQPGRVKVVDNGLRQNVDSRFVLRWLASCIPLARLGVSVDWRFISRPTGLLVGLIGAAAVLGGLAWWVLNGWYAGDTLTYWLAGQRILVGHELYRIGPDDPWLIDIRPYGLYSPPLLAVPWIGLAALPGIIGMALWWLVMAFAALWAVAALLLGSRGWAGLPLILLTPALTLLIGVGNVDALVLAGCVGAWQLRDRPISVGFLLGFLASLKLTPAVLVIWLVATRRWQAFVVCLLTAAALAVAVGLILGPGVFVDYLGVMAGGAGSGRPWALAFAVAGLVAVILLGRRERFAFAVAVATIPIGSPVAAIHTWALLAGALAPWLTWPPRSYAAPVELRRVVGASR